MKATITNLTYSKKVRAYRKENSLHRQVSIIDRDTGAEIVASRIYWPGSVCYACVWIHGNEMHGSGAGKAGGGGYHMPSAAVEAALSDAGIALSEDVGGRGDTALEDALHAVAAAVTGKRKFFMVRAHG